MAGRSMTAAAKTQAAASQNLPILLVEVQFDAPTGTQYLTDSHRNISYGGHSYLGAGYLLGISAIQETAEALIHTLTMSFSGIDQSWISNVLNEKFMDRRVLVYRGFLNPSTDALIADPFLTFDGRMDQPSIAEDPESGTCTVGVTCTNHWTDFTRRPGRHTVNSEQWIHFPGDPSFNLCTSLKNAIKWPDLPPWL